MSNDVTVISTPIGHFTAVSSGGVCHTAGFDMQTGPATPDARIRRRLQEYFDGDAAALDHIDVLQSGPAFLMRAWEELRAVPAGTTVSYSELAARSGNPRAVRAAASACARNAVCLIVPCHRVLRSGGGLGGYGPGLERKRWLLAHERAAAPLSPPAREAVLPLGA